MANAIRTLADRPSAPAEPKLALRDLVVTRRTAWGETVTATDRLTFDVAAGEFVCLLGPSGCGKTSLLNVLAGLVEPTSGQALLDGRPITGPGPDRAVLFQEPALFPWLSVRGNVELGMDLIGVPLSERRAVAQRWLANVHLEGWADAQPHELSAGMRQRVALARARRRPRRRIGRRAVRRPRRAGTRTTATRGAAGVGGISEPEDVLVRHPQRP